MIDLRKFAFDYKIPQSELVEVLGIAQSQVSNMMNGHRKVRKDHYNILRAKYGNIVDNYRTAGAQVKPAEMSPLPQSLSRMCDVQGAYSAEDVTDDCDIHCPARLPYVKSEVVQSRNINIKQLILNKNTRLEHRSLRELLGGEVDYVQKVITAAMMPLFQPGDYLFIRFLPDDAKLISGAIYLVDSKAYGAMVRQVYVEDNILKLHSLNTEFKELEVRREEIYSISLVVRSLRSDFNMPEDVRDMATIPNKREVQMHRLLDMHDAALAEITRQNERLERERERQDRLIDKILGGGDR